MTHRPSVIIGSPPTGAANSVTRIGVPADVAEPVAEPRPSGRGPTVIGSGAPSPVPLTSTAPTQEVSRIGQKPISVPPHSRPTTIASAPPASSIPVSVTAIPFTEPIISRRDTPSATAIPSNGEARPSFGDLKLSASAAERKQEQVNPGTAPEPAPPSAHVSAVTALPGTRRVPVQPTLAQLGAFFPGADAQLLTKVQREVYLAPLLDESALSWLRFGQQKQEQLAECIKKRLSMAEGQSYRLVPTLLGQLKNLLMSLIEAMDGGFFRRPLFKVWADLEPQIGALESRLKAALPTLQTLGQELQSLRTDVLDLHTTLVATSMAGQYLESIAKGDAQQSIGARTLALTGSQALALEQLQLFEFEELQMRNLIVLVQDGVMLKLPAVYAQLTLVTTKVNDTQKLLATEALSDLVTLIERKL